MADIITARDANQRFSKLLGQVEAGESFVITKRGVPVARLVPEPAPDGKRRLTPAQLQALEESIAIALANRPGLPPDDLPEGWPRTRGDIYDDMFAERPGKSAP